MEIPNVVRGYFYIETSPTPTPTPADVYIFRDIGNLHTDK